MRSSAEQYERDMQLMMDVLRIAARESDFALKGGTAINLFVRDMPRISTDIDLTYLPLVERPHALSAIDSALDRIASEVGRAIAGARFRKRSSDAATTGLSIDLHGARTKIDVTPVLRGTVFPVSTRRLTARAEARYGFLDMAVLDPADLYAGKIAAALDRQHPRDLFDARLLLADEGIGDRLWTAFLVYATAGPRPIHELLEPARKPIREVFEAQFRGMAIDPVDVEVLEQAREDLVAAVHGRLDARSIAFLASIEDEHPDWSLLGVPHAAKLPALRWKLHNLGARSAAKRAADRAKFESFLAAVAARRPSTGAG